MPVTWCARFVYEITHYIKARANNLEVSVFNLWPNRLILDGSIQENKRLTKTNINKFEADDVEKFLRMSGLIRPVYIVS